MRKRGFTLIELLVVIAIIGLLATFAVVQLAGSREKARVVKGLAQSGQILRSVGDDLVARWDFDECSGTSAIDSSGYNNNGLITNGTYSSLSPSGQGCSLGFNANGSVSIANIPALGTQQTQTVWAYLKDISGYNYLIDEGNDNHFIRTLGNHPSVGSALGSSYWNGNTVLGLNKWHFFVTTFDGQKLTLYVDGALDKSQAVSPYPVPAFPILLGAWASGGRSLNGNIDDVRIYNRALTSEEVHRMYAEGISRSVAKKE